MDDSINLISQAERNNVFDTSDNSASQNNLNSLTILSESDLKFDKSIQASSLHTLPSVEDGLLSFADKPIFLAQVQGDSVQSSYDKLLANSSTGNKGNNWSREDKIITAAFAGFMVPAAGFGIAAFIFPEAARRPAGIASALSLIAASTSYSALTAAYLTKNTEK